MRTAIICSPTCSASSRIVSATIACAPSAIASSMAVRTIPAPVELTDDVTAKLEALTPLAPLHQPRCLAPVRAIKAIRPDLTQIACFDTAFHHGIAPPANRFAIPTTL